MRGGLTYPEEEGYKAMNRLALDHERHNVVVLPCCNTRVEVADLRRDTYVKCPNTKCGRNNVVLGNNLNPQIQTEVNNDEPAKRLIW